MSDEKSKIILDELKAYLKVRILESDVGVARKEELLDLLLKIVEMESK